MKRASGLSTTELGDGAKSLPFGEWAGKATEVIIAHVRALFPKAHVWGLTVALPETNAHVRKRPEIGQKMFPAEKHARARTRACSLDPLLFKGTVRDDYRTCAEFVSYPLRRRQRNRLNRVSRPVDCGATGVGVAAGEAVAGGVAAGCVGAGGGTAADGDLAHARALPP